MPRELWAKIAVEIVRDPKLILRAPWERWLWLGLICLTKEFGKDGVLTYDPRGLAVTLDLGVKPAAVQATLEAFEKTGMVRLLPDNAIELVHFKKRQAAGKDNPEAVAERQRRWRARHSGNGSVTGVSNGETPRDTPRDVTADKSVTRNAEEEEEEEEEEDQAVEEDRSVADGRPPPPPPVALLPQKPDDPLVGYLRATWPGLPNPEIISESWRTKWRGVNLLAEAKAARAYESETGTVHERPANFLRGWMRRAAENPGHGRPAGRSGFAQEGTAAWDDAKRKADERAARELERTKAMFAERDRIQRQGHE